MSAEKLAIDGGPKAVPELGPFPTKIGAEELLEILDMWEFSPENRAKIRQLIECEANLKGPHLFRYYNPKPSKVAAAEKAMSHLVGTKYCLAVNSCTSALVASYRALGVGAGDEVIVPAYTFFATSATVASSNGIPVIVEVDETLCLDPEAIERAITKRTKAIVPVHMRGAPAQMDAIMDIANKKGIPVVEDVAQAGGGSFGGKRLGSIGTMITTKSLSAAKAVLSPPTTSGFIPGRKAGMIAPPAGVPTVLQKKGGKENCSAEKIIA